MTEWKDKGCRMTFHTKTPGTAYFWTTSCGRKVNPHLVKFSTWVLEQEAEQIHL